MALRATLRRPGGLSLVPIARIPPAFPHQRLTSNHVSPSTSIATNLECERKFNVTDLLRAELEAGNAIQNLHFKKAESKTFQDKYFDIGTRFFDRGIWLRLRTATPDILDSGSWEAKVRIGEPGDCVNTKFEEISGETEVYSAIKKRLPHFSLFALKLLTYQHITVAIHTEREVWVANDEATSTTSLGIMLDKVNAVPLSDIQRNFPFSHVTGEVEASKALSLENVVGSRETAKRDEVASMDTLLKNFMVNRELFPTEPVPVGKISAYHKWMKKIEYKEMLEKLRRDF